MPTMDADGTVFKEEKAPKDLGLNFFLGAEYERRKQKLQQELQLDYKHYVSKKNDVKSSEHHAQPETLSLPIQDKTTVKDKLREERNKEYNLFLKKQAQNRKLKRASSPVSVTPGQVQHLNPGNISPQKSPPPLSIKLPPAKERPPSRRDAATLTEAVGAGRRRWTGGPGHRPRKRWQIYRPRESYYFEEESNTDEDEEFGFKWLTRSARHREESAQDESGNQERREKKASGDVKETKDRVTHNLSSGDQISETELEMTGGMKRGSRSAPGISNQKADLATGLMIGVAEEKTVAQMRKEQYRQELLKQIAEQQSNKIKEKKLELRVAATGATDPEKEPDRIKHLGAVKLRHDSSRREAPHDPGKEPEDNGKSPDARPQDGKPSEASKKRSSFGNSRGDYNVGPGQLPGDALPWSGVEGLPSLDGFSGDYHRDFSNVLGGMAVPRVAAFVPPPAPPILPERYTTPYDAAYYYYGTRNPLEPNLPYIPRGLPKGDHFSGNVGIPSQSSSRLRCSGDNEVTPHDETSRLYTQDESGKRRESFTNYEAALKQQIKEKEEQKRREKEDEKRYDAKIEAEMNSYNPWGRSGGGAPIKDQKGDILSNLSQMHKLNNDTSRNPSLSPGVAPPVSHRLTEESPPQQLNMQNKYKEALKQQIEENRRKQEEERERIRMKEEEEEKKLAAQRARMRQEYEDEQRKEEKIRNRVKSQNLIHQPKPPQQEARRTARQESEREEEPQRAAKKLFQFNYEQREPSPPVPAVLTRWAHLESRPSSGGSQLSSKTPRSVSAPHDTAEIPRGQECKQEVIRELSALRRHLRTEQKQLEAQMGRRSPQEAPHTPSGRRRPRVYAFESARREAERRTAPLPATAHVSRENIREFNQLKYRGTTSREEVRTMFPDPPADAQSLDIQQQALLREQQRKIRLMNRQKDHDFPEDEGGHYYPRKKQAHSTHSDPSLESETTFIDFYGGDGYEGDVRQRPSAERRDRTATRRGPKRDEPARPVRQRQSDSPPTDRRSLQSDASLQSSGGRTENQQHVARQDLNTGGHRSRTGRLGDDELDDLSLRSALEGRVSVETVATEPWLRPGTSEAVKAPDRRERTDAAPRQAE